MPEHDAERRQRLIREVPLLARLTDDDLRALARRGHEAHFHDGEVIVAEGDTDRSLHVVLEGGARISIVSPGGDEVTLARIPAGDCFGEMALFDGRPRSASVTAEGETRTFVVTREALLAWLEGRPRAALALLETLALRLRKTDESLTDFFFLDLPRRLAKQLIALSNGRPGATLALTQAELATSLGVTRESVNKALNQFRAQGWIRLGRGRVIVDDPGALHTFAVAIQDGPAGNRLR